MENREKMITGLQALLPAMEAGVGIPDHEWRWVALRAEEVAAAAGDEGDALAEAVIETIGFATEYRAVDDPRPDVLTFRESDIEFLRRLVEAERVA